MTHFVKINTCDNVSMLVDLLLQVSPSQCRNSLLLRHIKLIYDAASTKTRLHMSRYQGMEI